MMRASAKARATGRLLRGSGREKRAEQVVRKATVAAGESDGSGEWGGRSKGKKRVLSGVQPTGSLHLGNYLGAMRQWAELQRHYEALFCTVDLHAVTAPHEPRELYEATRKSAALYIACGIDPSESTIFVQSHVPAHSELAWLLNCVSPMGWAERMIQFKEKARKHGESVSIGLFDYPLLMAADILLYAADLVPVGEDQRQHLELTQHVAERVNHLYGGKPWKRRKGTSPSGRKRGGQVLKVPEPLIPPSGARVMSLQDGTEKMSKSNPSELSRIHLLDPPDEVRRKVKRSKTDSLHGIEPDNPDRPEAANLLLLYRHCAGLSEEAAARECTDMKWADFKPRLADAVVELLRPIQARYEEVTKDRSELDRVLAQGASRARELAHPTLLDVRDAMGFIEPPSL